MDIVYVFAEVPAEICTCLENPPCLACCWLNKIRHIKKSRAEVGGQKSGTDSRDSDLAPLCLSDSGQQISARSWYILQASKEAMYSEQSPWGLLSTILTHQGTGKCYLLKHTEIFYLHICLHR